MEIIIIVMYIFIVGVTALIVYDSYTYDKKQEKIAKIEREILREIYDKRHN